MNIAMDKVILSLSMFLCLGACANQNANRSLYDMIDSRACIDEVGYPNCHPEKMDYGDYKEQRDAIKRGK